METLAPRVDQLMFRTNYFLRTEEGKVVLGKKIFNTISGPILEKC